MTVEFRLPDAGQLLLLSVVPALLVYNTYVRGDPPGGLELVFVTVIYALMLGAIVVEGGLESPNYLLVLGFPIAIFSVVLYVHDNGVTSLLVALVGLLMGFRGVQLQLRRAQ